LRSGLAHLCRFFTTALNIGRAGTDNFFGNAFNALNIIVAGSNGQGLGGFIAVGVFYR